MNQMTFAIVVAIIFGAGSLSPLSWYELGREELGDPIAITGLDPDEALRRLEEVDANSSLGRHSLLRGTSRAGRRSARA